MNFFNENYKERNMDIEIKCYLLKLAGIIFNKCGREVENYQEDLTIIIEYCLHNNETLSN